MLCYFHVGQINHWRSVVAELSLYCRQTRLLEECSEIRIGVAGASPKEATRVFGPQGRLVACGPVSDYEFTTLRRLWLDAQAGGDEPLLYFHTKGVSKRNCNSQSPSAHWRRYLAYWLIERRADALQAIQDGAELVGIEWIDQGEEIVWKTGHRQVSEYAHFSGNFWLASPDYVRRLPEPVNVGSRYDAEKWIGTGSPKRYELFTTPHKHHYDAPILSAEYRDRSSGRWL